MKKLKLDHDLAQEVLSGKKSSTWRLFDDKDLSVNDTVLLIDKVESGHPETWQAIGTARIDKVVQRRLGEMTPADTKSYEQFSSRDDMLAKYRRYYGSNVDWDTPVKVVSFTFSPQLPAIKPSEILPRVEKITIYADGGSRGNPGPSASGYVLMDESGAVLVYRGMYLGVTTNNQAEYTALKLALEEAKNLGAREVRVYMDSLLVVNQMRGIFKVKNRDLWPIHEAIKNLSEEFRHISFTQIPREANKLADAAVNQALDEQLRHQPILESQT